MPHAKKLIPRAERTQESKFQRMSNLEESSPPPVQGFIFIQMKEEYLALYSYHNKLCSKAMTRSEEIDVAR